MYNRKQLFVLGFAMLNCIGDVYSQKPPLGKAIRVYDNYRSLSENVKIDFKSEKGNWFFREPSNQVFKNVQIVEQYLPLNSYASHVNGIDLEMCDSIEHLFEAHFRGFKVEGLEKPWQIFSGNWSENDIAEYFGIERRHLDDYRFCYLLVTTQKHSDSQRIWDLPEELELNETVSERIGAINIQNYRTDLTKFFNDFGSHYIESYTTGNTMYQVLVFTKDVFTSFNTTAESLRSKFLTDSAKDFSNIIHHGAIKTASGNRTVETWAHENLHTNYYAGAYDAIFDNAYNDLDKIRRLYALLQDEVIVQMNLRSMQHFFKDPDRRNWVREVIGKYSN